MKQAKRQGSICHIANDIILFISIDFTFFKRFEYRINIWILIEIFFICLMLKSFILHICLAINFYLNRNLTAFLPVVILSGTFVARS